MLYVVSTLLGVQLWVRFCRQEFGEFPRLVGRYCDYLLPKQAMGTPQILVDKTSPMTGCLRVYFSDNPTLLDVAIATLPQPACELTYPAITVCKKGGYNPDEYVRVVFDNFQVVCHDEESCNETSKLRAAFPSYLKVTFFKFMIVLFSFCTIVYVLLSAMFQETEEESIHSLFRHNSIYDRIIRMMGPELDKVVDNYRIDPTKEYGGHFAKLIQSYLINDPILEEDEEDSVAISAMRQLFLGNMSKESNDTLPSVLGYLWNATDEDGSGEVKRVRHYPHLESLLTGLLNESQLLDQSSEDPLKYWRDAVRRTTQMAYFDRWDKITLKRLKLHKDLLFQNDVAREKLWQTAFQAYCNVNRWRSES